MPVQQYPPNETPSLVQGSGVQATKDTPGGVVTAAQLSAGATQPDTIVIGIASEAFDNLGGGSNDLVGAESAVIDLHDDQDDKAHFGHNSVAKVRMDNAAPVRHRILSNSAAYYATSQPETGFQDLVRAAPNTIDRTILNVVGNPGATFARVSGDMALWHGNKLYLPVVVDGTLWGLPLTYLGDVK